MNHLRWFFLAGFLGGLAVGATLTLFLLSVAGVLGYTR